VKKEYGHKLCLIGNIDLAYTLTRGTPQEVEEEVKLRIKQLAPGGGYVVSSANTVTEYVPLANFKAMREAVFKYGKYPISL
jgi:uroporphyrinogen decarboxylase